MESAAHPLTKRVLTAIRQLDPNAVVRASGPLQLRLSMPREATLDLGSLKAQCDAQPGACEDQVQRFARVALSGGDAPLSADSIVPLLKPRDWVAANQTKLRDAEGGTQSLVSFAFASDLVIILANDARDAMRILTASDLDELGLTEQSALDQAYRNLQGMTSGFRVKEVAPGLLSLAQGDSFDASRVLLHPHWRGLVQHVEGDLLVAPVGRDIVLITGTESQRGLDALRAVLQVEESDPRAPYPITTDVFRWTEEAWVPYAL